MELVAGNDGVQPAMILCCQCGISIEPNPANMCVGCIRVHVDITEGIPKQGTMHFCKACERYLQPPNAWVKATLESRELLGLCLKKLKGLNKVRLVDAGFAWTEPHSKRIKVKLTIQKEVLGGAVLQQVFIVEFTVNSQMCDDCHRVEAKNFWKAVVQVRQKIDHKKTFFYLEQLILKHKAHSNTLNIKPIHDGLDFFYATKDHARKMVDFLQQVVPCRYVTAQQLISHDCHSNVYNYKYTFSVDIVPICKDNIVCLPAKLARSLGAIGQLCLVSRVTQAIHLIDPFTAQVAELPANVFWQHQFGSLCSVKNLSEYTVMNIEFLKENEQRRFAGQGTISHKHQVADVWVVRSSELGLTMETKHTRSHLGHLLGVGDAVLGFDLANTNINDSNFDSLKSERIPDVILVKKVYLDKSSRHRRRQWKLKHLDVDAVSNSMDGDYQDFLEDLEEDPDVRQNVNIYKNPAKIAVDMDEAGDETLPQVTLQEMLDDLHLDGEETDMME